MGWSGANPVFDAVASALQDAGVTPEAKFMVLERLIGALQDEDWDTEDESLERFRADPVIVDAFRRRGIPPDD